METNEALKRIDEISKIIESSNKVLFSGERMIIIGIMVALVPLLEWASHILPSKNWLLLSRSTIPQKKIDKNLIGNTAFFSEYLMFLYPI